MTNKEPNNLQLNFKVDKYTRELIQLISERENITESEYLRKAVQSKIQAGMTRDGRGKSYYAVVIDMIAKLKAGK
jgi:endonuclease III-like uncharacterized protein